VTARLKPRPFKALLLPKACAESKLRRTLAWKCLVHG
jgi:hypothetical protein